MNKLWLLVKINLLEQFRISELKLERNAKRRNNVILITCVFLFLGFVIAGYASGAAYGLVYYEMDELVAPIALTASFIMTLFFTIFKTNGILFGYHDYDLLTALPVKTSTLVASRFLQLYFSNLIFCTLIMFPMGIVYGILANKGVPFYLIWILCIPFSCLIPTTIAAAIGVLIMAISSRMKHPQIVSGILSILLLLGIFSGSLFLGISEPEMNASLFSKEHLPVLCAQMLDSLYHIYPMTEIFQKSLAETGISSLLHTLLFVGISSVWYYLFLKVCTLFYKRIQSALTAHTKAVQKFHYDKNTVMFRQHSSTKAIYLKEWKRFLHSNMYLMNMGVGIIMLVFFTIVLLFSQKDQLLNILTQNPFPKTVDIGALLPILIPFLLAAVSGMCCPASCSLSLEGKNIDLIKSLPISSKQFFLGKICMNLALVLPISFVCYVCVTIRFSQNILQAVWFVLIPLSFNIFSAVFGMFANIKFPNYSWETETVVIKQSAASFLGLFGSSFLAILCGIIAVITYSCFYHGTMLLVLAILWFLIFVLYRNIMKKSIPDERK